MARSDDRKDGKRGPTRPKAASTPKKETPAKAGKRAMPLAAPRKKAAAALPPRKSVKAASAGPAAPSGRRSTPAARGGAAAARTGARAAKPSPPGRSTPRSTSPASGAKKPAAPRPQTEARKKSATRKRVTTRERAIPMLDEEQRIEDAKYQPRDQPARLFEEERFVFPESYGQSRIRLLVKDPEWLFAHWDVDPQSLADLRAELGERASALSRLTLRVSDPQHGGESRILVPDGSRSWYVRADTTERSYRAELGLTLPSGEFRGLAASNTVRTPRTGPAPGAAPRRVRYDGAVIGPEAEASAPARPARPSAPAADPGPWRPDPSTGSHPGPGGAEPAPKGSKSSRRGERAGGASDAYRR